METLDLGGSGDDADRPGAAAGGGAARGGAAQDGSAPGGAAGDGSAGPGSAGRGSAAQVPRWLLPAVLLTIVAAVLVGLDQRERGREAEVLLTRVTTAQSSIRYADARVRSMVAYTSPQLLSATAPDRVRASLRSLVMEAAAQQLGTLRERRQAVAAVPVAAWHGGLREARDAYLDYLDERIAVLQEISVDLRALYRSHPESSRLLLAARSALLAISPDAESTAQVSKLLV